ncbi:hypothetical protein F2Q69_00014275 [Brassica cretica]|uniref:Uncharacterized protein n=1 Tax=Brassica cretica TaxID=69181 RepID=A0A8S9QWW5_BRACR|nr:hypothetical protein F2Q69_00014275 [Brassica cretica]
MRSLHTNLSAEVKANNESINTRFDILEAMMFNSFSPHQAAGKAPMDPGPSHPPTPNNFTPFQPPDPPDLPDGYATNRTTPHNNALSSPIAGRFSELYNDPLAEIVALKLGSDSVVEFLDKSCKDRLASRVFPHPHTLQTTQSSLQS